MSDPRGDVLTPDRGEAERLSLGWNALVQGETGALDRLDTRDAAAIRRLGDLASHPRPRPVFVNQLKERLMDTTVSDLVRPPTMSEPPLSALPPVVEPVVAMVGRRRPWGGLRLDFGLVATVALVFAVVMSGYFSLWSPKSGENRGVLLASPPSLTNLPPGCTDYFYGCPSVSLVGSGFVNHAGYDAADLEADQVQLQDWSLDPGATLRIPGNTPSVARGAAVDIVVAGAYTVTVDGPAVINRAASPMFGDVEYLAPGTTAELSRGDAISYPIGRARTIGNPLSTTGSHVKSVVFYVGDVSVAFSDDPVQSGVRVRVDGNGRLPNPLAAYRTQEITVMLDYVQVIPGTHLPDERHWMTRVIGPVDPVQPDIEEGYVVWVGESRG